jgi:prevent-host-death family protein
MATIGVRELKEHTSRVLRRVREQGEEIDVTHHGRVVARLVPVSPERVRPRATAAAWATLDQVAREIGARWPKGRSAAKAVKEGRRDL